MKSHIDLDITQSKARRIVKNACKDFEIDKCNLWFININDSTCVGWYSPLASNMSAYMMIEKKWSRRLILVLHELTHHIQYTLYEEDESAHGKQFSLAKSRISTWARVNISKKYDWIALLTATSIEG